MTAYTRLLLVLSSRRVVGRVAALSAIGLPGGIAWASRLPPFRQGLPEASSEAHAAAFFIAALVTLGFTSLLTGASVLDERLEARISVLRVSGVDGVRAMAQIILHVACVAALLGGLSTASAAIGAGWTDPLGLATFGAVVVLGGIAVSSVGVIATALFGRPTWTLLGLGAALLVAVSSLEAVLDAGASRPALMSAALVAALLGTASVLAAPVIAQRYPRLGLGFWT